jgi:hypothetical protein
MEGALYNAFSRVHGNANSGHIMWLGLQWCGLVAVLAVIGAIFYLRNPPIERLAVTGPVPNRPVRAILAGLLLCAVALPVVVALRVGTTESLNRHVGYGLLLAAPMGGNGLARIIGGHFSRLQIGIAVWILSLGIGAHQAREQYGGWPTTTPLTTVLQAYYHPGDRVYLDVDETELYYLHAWDDYPKWTSTYWFPYITKNGKRLTNAPAYQQAIKDGYFDIIAYDPSYRYSTVYDKAVSKLSFSQIVAASGNYHLVAVLPMDNHFQPYYVWLKVRKYS